MIDFEAIFKASSHPYVVFTPDLTIVAVNDAYLDATRRSRESLLGVHLFTAFPADPEDPDYSNAYAMRASLERVIATGKADALALQKYPLPVPGRNPGDKEFDEHFWSIVNTPILDAGGKLAYVCHNPVDVTELYRLQKAVGKALLEGGVLQQAHAIQENGRRLDAELLRLRRLFEQAPGFIAFMHGPEHVFDLVNQAFYRLIGDREIVGKPARQALPEMEGQGLFELLDKVNASGEAFVGHDIALTLQLEPGAAPTEIHLDLVLQPIIEGDGSVSGIFVQGHDITEHKHIQRALLENEAFLRRIMGTSPDCIKVLDQEGRLVMMNTGGRRQMEIDDIEAYLMRPWVSFLEDEARELTHAAVEAARRGESSEFQARWSTAKGNSKWWDVRVAPMRDAAGSTERILVISRDSTLANNLLQRMSYEAAHDPLTGLVNRSGFEKILQLALLDVEEQHRHYAMLYLDLDRFKIVNDLCGHDAGDELLRQVSALLLSRMRESDTLARLGGDEFSILLDGCQLNEAERIADSLVQVVEAFRFTWKEKTFTISASIGVVEITRDLLDLKAVIGAADSACYRAKDQGRNCVSVYRPKEFNAPQPARIDWPARIRQALRQDRFRLYCQKIFDGKTQQPAAEQTLHGQYEILLRLEGEDQLIVQPMAFIPAAERYQLMPAIDRWVTAAVLETLSAPQFDLAHNWYSINLSGMSLSDESFLSFVMDKLHSSSVPPQAICFELSETAAIHNVDAAARFVNALREAGCHIALDHFGTGLSSFNYLKTLPVDHLKIDGLYVKGMMSDPMNQVIVKAINEVGHAMGKKTVAEFVEDKTVADELARIGVDYLQGYALHAPEPLRPF